MNWRTMKKVRKHHIIPRTFNRYVRYVRSFVIMFAYNRTLYSIIDDGKVRKVGDLEKNKSNN